VLFFERLQRAPVTSDENGLGDEKRHQGGEDEGAGEEDEEPDPSATGTPAHDNDIIAAASSHSCAGTDFSTRARPIASRELPAVPPDAAFLSTKRGGGSLDGSRWGPGKGPSRGRGGRITAASRSTSPARRRDRTRAAAIPQATASPCLRTPRGAAASRAWP